jgi:hypothetical protein
MRDGTDLDKFAKTGKIALLAEFSQICPDQMDINKIFQNGSRGLISKICHNEEHYQIRHEKSYNSSMISVPRFFKDQRNDYYLMSVSNLHSNYPEIYQQLCLLPF